ncbi:MAG TPA: single-stranded DNA-binding protein [Campylobacterales bacterium]|nr:single-stranded DNA-binding protein [Campylobacterales bacterium]
MYNKVVLVGNLTRDIELKYLQSGTAIGNTAIATSRKFKGSDGSQKEEVCFIDVSAFGRTAEVMNQYLKKGSKVLVDGRLKLDQWQDQNGNKRSKHSVIVESMQMLDSKGDNNGGNNNSYNSAPPQQNNSYNQQQNSPANTPRVQEQQPSSIPEIDIDDDEIPF